MIDTLAAIFGMTGSALNMNLSPRLQTYGLALWLISDIILIVWAWDKSFAVVIMMVFYICTCSYGIFVRWGK